MPVAHAYPVRPTRLGGAAFAVWLLVSLSPGAEAQSDSAALAEQARLAMEGRRFSEAADLYETLTNRFPSEPTLLANWGMALHLSGNDEAAVAPLRKAAANLPDSFPAHFFLGASLTRLARFREAVEPLRRAGQLNRSHPFAQALLGDALEAEGRFGEALRPWRILLALEDSNPYAHAGLVRCHEQLAAQALDHLRQQDPESPYLLRLLAEARMAAEQYPSAFYLYRQALERSPGLRELHESVAEIYERTGHHEWAVAERRRAAALPAIDCMHGRTPACLYAAGEYQAVLGASLGETAEDLHWAARSHAQLAERYFKDLQALPESVDQLRLLASIFGTQGEHAEAGAAIQRALELRRNDGRLQRQLAEHLFFAGRGNAALPWLERFCDEDPHDPRWPSMLGSLMAGRQELQRAVTLLEAALDLPGAPASASLDLGRSYLALGEPAAAIKHLAAARALDTDGSVHYQLAQAYQRTGLRDEASQAMAVYREISARVQAATAAASSLEILAPE